MAQATDVTQEKASVLFDNIWKTYSFMEQGEESTSSDKIQSKLAESLENCVVLIDRINELRVFSTNEDIEEVATGELRYLLLSGLLGYLTIHNTKSDRFELVTKAQNHYIDYLRLAKNYGITDIEVADVSGDEDATPRVSIPLPNSSEELKMLSNRRERKIKQYKVKKETDKQLNELYQHVQKEHVDEEVKRNYYMTLLKKWVFYVEDELDSIQSELPILQHMAEMKKRAAAGQKEPEPKPQPRKTTFRPFILTRNEMQKKVLGAGYRNLPTYTVEQWYDMEAAAGRLPNPEEVAEYNKQVNDPNAKAIQAEKEDLEKEAKLEVDDPEALQKARNWDDWKDDNRRGWGNRQNMG